MQLLYMLKATPDDDKVHYVGVTRVVYSIEHTLNRRAKEHAAAGRRGDSTAVARWARSLGRLPTAEPLGVDCSMRENGFPDRWSALALERFWIHAFIREGHPIKNMQKVPRGYAPAMES